MEPFLGQIVMFAGGFAPRGWALCNGQLLSISSNSALFAILGTIYGGDGETSFAVPDLRGRLAMHPGSGPGLTPRALGQRGGAEEVVLDVQQIPPHSHSAAIQASSGAGTSTSPVGNFPAGNPDDEDYQTVANGVMAPAAVTVGNTGGNSGHSNVQPFQCVNFIIATQGIFPSES